MKEKFSLALVERLVLKCMADQSGKSATRGEAAFATR
jgi:hypothetical protein